MCCNDKVCCDKGKKVEECTPDQVKICHGEKKKSCR